METKGFLTKRATVSTLASVYKRSFTPDIHNCKKAPCPVPLIGYARISTEDQTALPQVEELRSAGCVEIVEEQGLPVLTQEKARLRHSWFGP